MYVTMPVRLLDPEGLRVVADTMTENVSPQGARVVVKTHLEPDALLLLKSLKPKFRMSVRVVYCESLSGGRFGIGLQLRGAVVNWTEDSMDIAA